jgi:hypothetical protein
MMERAETASFKEAFAFALFSRFSTAATEFGRMGI